MARKKSHEEHVDESWLIPYADILTLLLALFIVLFALSNVDAEKFQQLAESFSSAFGGAGPLPNDGHDVIPGQVLPRPTPGGEDEYESPTPVESGGPGQADPELQGLIDSLNNYVSAHEDLSENIELLPSSDGVLVRLSSDVWFEVGKAELTPNMREFSEKLADLLEETQRSNPNLSIVVSGHTDSDAVTGGPYQSNWDLSLARAYSFLKVMVSREDLNPGNFSVRGYGEHAPIAPNDTPENKQRNRRVEVLISLSNEESIVQLTAPLSETD